MFIASVLAFLAVAQANVDFVKVNRLAHPDAIPANWKENYPHKVSGGVKGSVSTYLVINEFVGSSTCDGTAKMSVGTGFEVCTATSSESSMMYKTSSKAGYYVMAMYSTPDCTGTGTTYDYPVPTYCLPSGTNGYKYAVVNSTAPWKDVTMEGTVDEIYATSEDCAGTGSGNVYSWFSTDYCMASTGDDGSAMSTLYNACSGDQVTFTTFSDTACTSKVASYTVPNYACTKSDADNDYITRVCTSSK